MRVFVFALLTLAAGAHEKLPVAFEPNQGQATGGVQFVAHGPGYSLALEAGRAELRSRGGTISATLVGARPAQGSAEAPLPGVVNYLVGDAASWHTGIPTFARVRYREVYPGIDLVYYGNEGRLEYDFVLAPGADARRIAVRYEGARRLRLNAAGDLLLEAASGEMRQHRPQLYQETNGVRRKIPGRYILRGQTVHFAVGAYDHSLPLVIDPALTWSSYYDYGSGTTDEVIAVAVDASGNVYGTGYTITPQGDYNCFVTKFNSTGATRTPTPPVYVGGTGDDECFAIAVDSSGNIYVAGATDSDDLPNFGVPATLSGAGVDGFVARIDPTFKNFGYVGYLGGATDDFAYSIALDVNNNLWVAGTTNSTNFPVTRTGAQRQIAGGFDGFLSQFDSTGALLYSSFLGGTGDDYILGIGLDAAGNLYTAGSTTSKDLPGTSSGLQTANAGGVDAWVARLAPDGTLGWATYLGGTGDDEANSMAVDSSGATYITGDTTSTNFPTANAFQGAYGGGAHDMIAAKISPDGKTLVYSTYLGGSDDDVGYAVAVDFAGNAYVGGSTLSTNFPSVSGFQATKSGGSDGTITAFSPDGKTLQFSSFIGGTGTDYVSTVAVSCTSGLVIGGTTVSTNFPVTAGVNQARFGGGPADGFLAQIAAGTAASTIATGGIVNAVTFASAPVAPGSLVSIFGANLAGGISQAGSVPLPSTLGGTTVTVNGATVPLVYVSPGQINFQLPYEVTAGTASATLTAACGTSSAVTFQVAPVAPYLLPGPGGLALVQNQDFSINGASNAAAKGSVVTVYLIGIGPLDKPVATGAAAPGDTLSRPTSPVKVTIGGFATDVQFLGLAPGFVGLAQANLFVPNLSPGRYPIVITIGGVASNAADMFVK